MSFRRLPCCSNSFVKVGASGVVTSMFALSTTHGGIMAARTKGPKCVVVVKQKKKKK